MIGRIDHEENQDRFQRSERTREVEKRGKNANAELVALGLPGEPSGPDCLFGPGAACEFIYYVSYLFTNKLNY
jgi:hypothetical protein